MKHNMEISITTEKKNGKVVCCRNVSIREKLLRYLLGEKQRLTIIVPGDSVEHVAINEVEDGKGYQEEGDTDA
ncbi:MAG: hypothetical protein ACYCYM_14330 [Saccharofermentanales bacterium]